LVAGAAAALCRTLQKLLLVSSRGACQPLQLHKLPQRLQQLKMLLLVLLWQQHRRDLAALCLLLHGNLQWQPTGHGRAQQLQCRQLRMTGHMNNSMNRSISSSRGQHLLAGLAGAT
jgi:hypothetical protein